MSKGPGPGQLPGWREMPAGAVITEAGNAVRYQTGDWRSLRPEWSQEKCIQCLLCWVFCPDGAIIVRDGKIAEFDFEHCKGCGICAQECPPKVKAIKMVPEEEVTEVK